MDHPGTCEQKWPTERNLPSEIWVSVFGHLSVSDLRMVRLVCRAWKQLVDTTLSVKRRWAVRFRHETMDHSYRPVGLPSAAAVYMCRVTLKSVNSWWPTFGQGLVDIWLENCKIFPRTLFGMLRQVPLLKEFVMIDFSLLKWDGEIDVNFRLDILDKLVLTSHEADKKSTSAVLGVFAKICPRLKFLTVYGCCFEKKSIVRMIKAVETTLKGIKVDATGKVLETMSNLKQLHLRHVAFLSAPDYNRDLVVKLFRAQPDVVELDICGTMSPFLGDLKVTPLNLVRITVELNSANLLWEGRILGQLPTLEYLEIKLQNCCACHGRDVKVNFVGFEAPNLKELRLSSIVPAGNSLLTFLAGCPGLQLLRIEHSIFEDDVDLDALPSSLDSLRTLEFVLTDVPEDLLIGLFRLCPKLERLELNDVDNVDDETVLQLCQLLKLLKRLKLVCYTTGLTADIIINNHGPELRELSYFELDDLENLDEDTRQKLEDHFLPHCTVITEDTETEAFHPDLVQF